MACSVCGGYWGSLDPCPGCGKCGGQTTDSRSIVSCTLCGASFVVNSGGVVPPHACLHSLPQPAVATWPTPAYIPPTLGLRDLFAALASDADVQAVKVDHPVFLTREEARFIIADRMLEARERKA